jgi:hypothetical protein
MSPEGTYLGDGLYAEDDNWSISLTADRDGQRHRVYLEPTVLAALIAYAKARHLLEG